MRDDGYKDDGLGDERIRQVKDLLRRATDILAAMQAQPSPSRVDPARGDAVQRRASAIGYIDLGLRVLSGGEG